MGWTTRRRSAAAIGGLLRLQPRDIARQPLLYRGRRAIVEEPLRLFHGRVRHLYVARLFRLPDDPGLAADGPAYRGDQVLQGDSLGIAEVEYLKSHSGRSIQRGRDSIHDVVHEGVVAACAPVAVHGYRVSGTDTPHELRDRHVGA